MLQRWQKCIDQVAYFSLFSVRPSYI
jgi:hypothetical protein